MANDKLVSTLELLLNDSRKLIAGAYTAFNRRDIDAAFALMSDDVSWPKASEGGRVVGKDAIREYWTRQWQAFDPRVEPIEMTERSEGVVDVEVRQVVRNPEGAVLFDGVVRHVYTVSNGLIDRMDLDEGKAGPDASPSSAFSKT